MFSEYAKNKAIYQKIVALRPGQFRLTITAKDAIAGNYTVFTQALTVPRLDPDRLTASSLVLADILEPVPSKQIGAGQFVLGEMKVRPRVDNVFQRDERVGIYLNVYNFGDEANSHKPSGDVTYELTRAGSGEVVARSEDDVNRFAHASASQVTVREFLNLKDLHLTAGRYVVTVKVADRISGQNVSKSAELVVK
jgi:hypothetical protein